jgi:hypothetical protein
LTGHTGTEQALKILNSGAVRSFDILSNENINVLVNIFQLAPSRKFYPSHLRDMQTVNWSRALSFLSQHGRFITAVTRIREQANANSVFHPESSAELKKLSELN